MCDQKCELCGARWQPPHFGSRRKCAFEGEVFSASNWNCGIANAIRSAFEDDERAALRYRSDDIGSYGALVVSVPDTDPQSFGDYAVSGLLVGEWYKDRGCTDELKWAFVNQGNAEVDSPLSRADAVLIFSWLGPDEDDEE